MWKDLEGSIHMSKSYPKENLQNIFDELKALYNNDDEIVQFFYLNNRDMESQTAEEVGMEDKAHIECFNFLNFFLGRDQAEMKGCNICVHFVQRRLVDTELLDEAVRVLWANNTVAEIIGDDDKGNVEEFP